MNKKVLKVVFITIIFLFVLLLEGWSIIERLNSRSSSLVYAYDIVKNNTLIGMSYSECYDYLENAKNEYGYFEFFYENVISDAEYSKDNSSVCRVYHVGYALNDSGRLRSYFLKIFFSEDKVVSAMIEEEKG